MLLNVAIMIWFMGFSISLLSALPQCAHKLLAFLDEEGSQISIPLLFCTCCSFCLAFIFNEFQQLLLLFSAFET